MKATRLGSGETAAHAADGTGSYPKDRLMLTDSPQYPHRCFTDEGDWVSCPPELCEADFLLREKQAAEAELAEAKRERDELETEIERLGQQMYYECVPKGEANKRIAEEQEISLGWAREANARAEAAEADNARLREALRKIATPKDHKHGDKHPSAIARAALADKEGT